MSISARFFLIAMAVGVAGVALAQTAPPPVRLRGTIEAVDNHAITVATREGTKIKVTINEDAKVSTVKAIDMSAIKAGSFIGTAAVPGADGELRSLEVVVFPEAMRGIGEGHYDWDLRPGSSMTNANVDAVVDSKDGRDLQLSYKGGSMKIRVPPNAPIVTIVPADRSALKPGLAVFTPAVKAPDGSFATSRVVIGSDGVKPPM